MSASGELVVPRPAPAAPHILLVDSNTGQDRNFRANVTL